MRGLTTKEAVSFIQEKCNDMSITAYEISKSTGISSLGIQNIINGKTKKPRSETVESILSYIENKVLNTQNATVMEVTEGYKSRGVPYYAVDFASGFSNLMDAKNSKPDFIIDYEPYNHADFWVNNIGNSMAPKIENGDLIALKQKQDIKQIIYGEIYAVVLPEMRTIKYLRKSKIENCIEFVPENLQEYDPQDMPIQYIEKFFLVLGSIKKFF